MSDSDKQALLDGTATIQTKIEVLSSDGESTILTEENAVVSWDYEDFRYVKDEGWIGQFVARQVNGVVKNISDDFSMTDKEFILYMGVKVGDTTTWYSLGNFLVNKVTDDEVNDKTSFEALDYTKKFNQTYVDSITYPCTALELVQNICEQCGCELGNTDFKHADWEITGNVFTNGESCREVLKAIGKLAYSWVRIDWDNKVYIDFTNESEVSEYNKIDNSKYYSLTTQKEKFGAVNRVVIGYKDIEGERTKVEDTESIEANGVNEITIFDNPLVYNQELREKAIVGAEDLFGLEYMPLEMLTVGHPWLKGYELVEVTDMENKVHKTIPFDRTIQYFGHIKTKISVGTNTKTNTEYAYESGIGGKIKKVEIAVDKINGQITQVIEEQDETNEKLNEVVSTVDETKQTISKVETTVTDITTTTQTSTGGNSLYLTDALESNVIEYHIEGKSEQETRSGKNKFNSDILTEETIDGITLTKNNDGTITLLNNLVLGIQIEDGEQTEFEKYNGEIAVPSPDYPSDIKSIPSIKNLCNGINQGYYINTAVTQAGVTSSDTGLILETNGVDYITITSSIAQTRFRAACINETLIAGNSTQTVYSGINRDGGYTITITCTDYEYIIVNATDLSKLMITPGKTQHDYIPYGAWAKVKVIGENLYDYTDVSYESSTTPVDEEGWITLACDNSSGTSRIETSYFTNITNYLKPSTTYAVVTEIKEISGTGSLNPVTYWQTSGVATNEIKYKFATLSSGMVKVDLFKTRDDFTNIVNGLRSMLSSSPGDNGSVTFRLSVLEDTTVTSDTFKYEPYQEKEVLIDLNKSNLLQTPYTENNKLTKTATKDDDYITTDYYAELEANKTYTFSCKTSGTFGPNNQQTQCYLLSDKGYTNIWQMLNKDGYTFTPTVSGKYYLRYDVNISGETHSFWDFAIYEGINSTPYYELSSINDTKDTLDIVNGQVVIDKKIGKITLNGTQTLTTLSDGYNGEKRFKFADSSIKNIPNDTLGCMCDKYKGVIYNDTKKVLDSISVWNNLNMFAITTSSTTKTVAELTEDLTNEPANVYYILDEEQQIILPNANIPLFEGINHVTLVEDLETTTSIKYYRNTPIAQDYVIQQQLDETNYNLSDTTDKTNQNTNDISSTNTNLNNNYYTKNQIDVINSSTASEITTIKRDVETKITAEDLNIAINKIQTTGATSVTTSTGYTFNKDGLKIQKSDSEMSSLLDNDGLVVKRNTTEVLTVRSSGVETENLKVRTYFTIGDNTRAENYKGGTGFFYIGDD